MIGNIARIAILATVVTASCAGTAAARSPYDGWWNLTIVTQRGPCDPTYDFGVQINNGRVSHPNLVRLHGRVVRGGVVRVSVTVGEKHAAGSGRLNGSTGRGRWSGYSGRSRCSGYWSARRN